MMQIRAAESSDMKGILELSNAVFSAQQRSTFRRNELYWNWKYQENPFGTSLLSLAEVDNKIVGVDNLWPWEFRKGDSIIRAVQACDSAVHPEHRGKGIFTSMRKHGIERAKNQDVDLIFNFPNANSLPVNLSLGWQPLGKIAWWVKIMKPADVISGRYSSGQAESLIIDEAYRIDPPLIHQVLSTSERKNTLFRIHRKPGFHAWRYENHPSRSYGMVHSGDGNYRTVAIFTINQKGKSREMVIVDLLGSPVNAQAVIKMALEAARNMGVGFVALMNNPEFAGKSLWKAGFMPRRLKNMVVLPLNPDLEGRVNHFSNWSLMAGMHDSI